MTDRIKKPKLGRTDPVRNWSAMFGGADASSGANGVLTEMITRSVDLGYRVIDEYVRQGQRAAEQLTGRTTDFDAMTGNVQEMSVRMAQYTSDLLGVWFQMMSAAMAAPATAGWSAPTATRPEPVRAAGPAAAAPAPTEPVRVRVEVASTQPVEVGLDLRPGAGLTPLIAHALRAVEPDKPNLTVTVVANGEPGVLRLRVRVADDHPAGVYSGLLLDEVSGLPVGALSLRVGSA
jgi:hypothetical protein